MTLNASNLCAKKPTLSDSSSKDNIGQLILFLSFVIAKIITIAIPCLLMRSVQHLENF